jgi:hypothetical protein
VSGTTKAADTQNENATKKGRKRPKQTALSSLYSLFSLLANAKISKAKSRSASVVLGGSSCYREDNRIAKSDSFSRLCSIITADYSAGIKGVLEVDKANSKAENLNRAMLSPTVTNELKRRRGLRKQEIVY